jgi:hypothetical protein
MGFWDSAGTGAAVGTTFGPVGTIVGGVLGAIGGGILGSAAESERERKIREQVARAQALARQGLITPERLASRLRDIDRLFNKRLISTLNSTAFGGRRLANANVAGASVAGQLGGQAEASKTDYAMRADTLNAGIYQNMANLEAGAPITNKTEATAAGIFGGLQVGLQAADIFNKPTVPNPNTNSPTPNTPMYNNPYNIVDYFQGYQDSPMNLKVRTGNEDLGPLYKNRLFK